MSGRLLKADQVNELDNVKVMLNRILEASNDLKDVYYILFDNLNSLYESYPNLYKQIEMIVKLPNNNDAKEISQMNLDLKEAIEHFNDEEYLKTYIK